MKSNIILGVVLLLSTSALACGTEAAPPSQDPTVGGSGTGTGTGTGSADAGATASVPAGTCTFTLVDGTNKTLWSGAPQAVMNGSGNLKARCIGRAEGSTEDSTIELHFGNATFNGPRTYRADDFSSDGKFIYEAPTGFSYTSAWKGSSCTLDLTEAGPLDGRGSSVVSGGRIAGTFACAKLISPNEDNKGGPLSVESGLFATNMD